MTAPFVSREDAAGVVVRIKAVPGASRDEVAGALGDRLKVRVSAPAEGGRANAAIERLLERSLGLARGRVAVVSGHSSPEKCVRISGAARETIEALAGTLRVSTGVRGRGRERPSK